MKQIFTSLMFLFIPFVSNAEDVEIDGLFYALNDDDKTAELVINERVEGDLVIPSSVEYDGSEYKVVRIGDCAFSYCDQLYTVQIPNSVTSIGLESFSYCSSLESVEMSENINKISEAAFWGCSSLTSMNLPDNIEYIGESVFEDCKALTEIKLPANLTAIGGRAFWGCSSLTDIDLPKKLKNIAEYAFWGCRSITSVTLPASLESIGCVSFVGCDMLGVIKCESAEPVKVDVNDYIEQKFFMSWTDQTVLYVPDGSESKYAEADVWNTFKECRGYGEGDVLAENVIRKVNEDGINYAVSDFNHVAKVTANNGFDGEAVIKDKIVVDGEEFVVKFIGDMAFENSPSIVSVEIPKTMEGIGQLAFSLCPDLMDVYIEVAEPFALDNYVFDTGMNYSMNLYVPVGSKQAYESTKYWSDFGHIIEKEYTAIESVSVNESDDDRIYDMQGREVMTPSKGVYVKNGKKILF